MARGEPKHDSVEQRIIDRLTEFRDALEGEGISAYARRTRCRYRPIPEPGATDEEADHGRGQTADGS